MAVTGIRIVLMHFGMSRPEIFVPNAANSYSKNQPKTDWQKFAQTRLVLSEELKKDNI